LHERHAQSGDPSPTKQQDTAPEIMSRLPRRRGQFRGRSGRVRPVAKGSGKGERGVDPASRAESRREEATGPRDNDPVAIATRLAALPLRLGAATVTKVAIGTLDAVARNLRRGNSPRG
jgi:hypothetical protein